jgi:hypothetical protein
MALWVGEAANPRWLPETGKALLTEDEVNCSIPTGLRFISFILGKTIHNQLCKKLPHWPHVKMSKNVNLKGWKNRTDQLLIFKLTTLETANVMFFLVIRKLGFREFNSHQCHTAARQSLHSTEYTGNAGLIFKTHPRFSSHNSYCLQLTLFQTSSFLGSFLKTKNTFTNPFLPVIKDV